MYFELDSIGALLMLFPRRHSGFRVAVVGELDMTDELPTVLQDRFHPISPNAKVAIAAKPMGVNPAAFASGDVLDALGGDIRGSDRQEKPEPGEGAEVANLGFLEIPTV